MSPVAAATFLLQVKKVEPRNGVAVTPRNTVQHNVYRAAIFIAQFKFYS